MTLVARILDLRRVVQDGTILDWLDLFQLLPEGTGNLRTDVMREHWQCSQATVSHRMTRLADAGLISYRAGGGRYRIIFIEQP